MTKKNLLAITALIAAGAGYLGGLLTAPRSGKQTRKKVAKSASRTVVKGEKQLKKLHSELNSSLKDAEKQVTKARTRANNELKEAIKNAKDAKEKARLILTALHDGDAEDPDLKAAIKQAKDAKNHLSKFVKS